jgi:hypothetical protein
MHERQYQAKLVKKIKILFPGCFVIRNDPRDTQGLPDIIILYENKWAMLEVKTSAKAELQPNQKYHVDLLNRMSFASFIYPENEERVLNELQRSFSNTGKTRVS